LKTWLRKSVLPALEQELRRHGCSMPEYAAPVELAALLAVHLLADARERESQTILKWIAEQRPKRTSGMSQLTHMAWNVGNLAWGWASDYGWCGEVWDRDREHLLIKNMHAVKRWAKYKVYEQVEHHFSKLGCVIQEKLAVQLASVLVPYLLADGRDKVSGQVLEMILAERERTQEQNQEAIASMPAASTEILQPPFPRPRDIARLRVERPARDEALKKAWKAVAKAGE
jgi:hypothetical protein